MTNVQKLIVQKMSIDAVPSGSGVSGALEFLSNADSIKAGYQAALTWVNEAINVVRSASNPNPWNDASDESIAAEILRRIDERRKVAS